MHVDQTDENGKAIPTAWWQQLLALRYALQNNFHKNRRKMQICEWSMMEDDDSFLFWQPKFWDNT